MGALITSKSVRCSAGLQAVRRGDDTGPHHPENQAFEKRFKITTLILKSVRLFSGKTKKHRRLVTLHDEKIDAPGICDFRPDIPGKRKAPLL
jgi:hypothetical protein